MRSSSSVWARWALVGLFGSTLVAACGAKDDKDKTRTDYPDDNEVAGPSTPPQAQFRQRTDIGALWTFGVKASF